MTEKTEALHVHELRGDNFKRLKHFAVKLQPGVTQVTGKNGAGKSTFLDVVRHLLGDASKHSAEVIRRGEESCQLMGDLGDFIVERRWRKSEKGELQTVVLKAKDGSRLQSPQAILDSFYNTYTFDPLAFARLDPKKQLEELRALVGISTGPIDGRRADLYEKRTEVNRKGGDLKARFLALRPPEKPLPEAPIDLQQLLEQQKALRAQATENERARNQLNNVGEEAGRAGEQLARRLRELDVLRKQVEFAEGAVKEAERIDEEARQRAVKQRELVKALVDPDFEAVGKQVREAEQTNLAIMREGDRKKMERELEALRAESEALSKGIEQLDQEKAKLIAGAKFPVAGLAFGPEGVLLNDFPLAQASAAEKMRVSTAIGFARNPRLKLLAIHDGSLLDDDSLHQLDALCAEYGGQLLVERVGASSDVGVLIEDGEVVPVRPVKGGQGDLDITLPRGGAA